MVVAGISGFRQSYVAGRIASADLLHQWAEDQDFVWLYSEEILNEYKGVLKRLHVRPAVIGALINLIRERGEAIERGYSADMSPDPNDEAFCACADEGGADLLFTLNPKDFPQSRIQAKVTQP